jgi:hypothetical protein
MELTALSLKQPFANWVSSGRKNIETRNWSTNYRGDLLICASLSGKGDPKGVALCVVELYFVRAMTKADEKGACVDLYPGAYAWLLRNVRILPSLFPVKGRLGLYKVNVDLEII